MGIFRISEALEAYLNNNDGNGQTAYPKNMQQEEDENEIPF